MKQKEDITAKVLENLKFESLNEIQSAMINADLKASNIVLLAPTGSGKTVAFLLPLLHQLNAKTTGVQALILVPSRELALQIEQVFRSMASGFKVNCCYGGHPMKTERNNFTEPPAVLIGTPGRIAAHLRRGSFEPESIHLLVLDEFDKSLELGFSDDMSYIIGLLPKIKKRILTSATQAIEIPAFSGVKNPVTLNYLTAENRPNIVLKAVRAAENDKLEILIKLICHLGHEPTLVFCNHREAVDRISEILTEEGVIHDTFHGGLEQDERERALLKFRNGSHQILITTDLASRGLDIPEIKNIIHYQGANTEEGFIHRNGRTARMNALGTSWLVLAEKESVPDFLSALPDFVNLPDQIRLPEPPQWITLYIGAGKKDKISKTDIVGFLIQKGKLTKEEIGLITILDNASFVAINRVKARQTIAAIKDEKVKNQKVRIAISN
ncbi:MAG: DEAD/DEAH box helicase [Mariniphaga sp.]|nr:DEAD/DEAH box helicase [Mariniphaga sp.]